MRRCHGAGGDEGTLENPLEICRRNEVTSRTPGSVRIVIQGPIIPIDRWYDFQRAKVRSLVDLNQARLSAGDKLTQTSRAFSSARSGFRIADTM